MKIVLVTGGRAYRDRERVFAVLDEEAPDLVVHGAARRWDPRRQGYVGADEFAGQWADDHDVAQLKVPYLRNLGPAGGPIRNTWALDRLHDFWALGRECLVIAFPGGNGTADTVAKARRAGFEIREVAP